jgi:hypothetical protein
LELTEGGGLVQAVHIVHGSGVLNLDENDELTLVFTGTRKSHIDSVELSTDDGTGCTTGHGVEDCPATSVHGLDLHCDQPCNAHVTAGAGSKRVLAGRL